MSEKTPDEDQAEGKSCWDEGSLGGLYTCLAISATSDIVCFISCSLFILYLVVFAGFCAAFYYPVLGRLLDEEDLKVFDAKQTSARGIIAVGQVDPLGVFVVGQVAFGVFVFGQVAIGCCTVGMIPLGLCWLFIPFVPFTAWFCCIGYISITSATCGITDLFGGRILMSKCNCLKSTDDFVEAVEGTEKKVVSFLESLERGGKPKKDSGENDTSDDDENMYETSEEEPLDFDEVEGTCPSSNTPRTHQEKVKRPMSTPRSDSLESKMMKPTNQPSEFDDVGGKLGIPSNY